MRLIGKKTILRPITLADATRYVKWMNDPEVGRLSRGKAKKLTLAEEKKWIKAVAKYKEARHFSIDLFDGTHIGGIGLKFIDNLNKNAEVGITIGDKRYWNKGYGTDSMILLIDYAFKKLKLHRIELSVHSYNERAIAVYKKLGFKKEGRQREKVLWDNIFYDNIQMGLLRSEWLK